MANDKTYYVKLKPSAGGKLIKVTGIKTYARTEFTVPGEVYRDEYTFTPGTLDANAASPNYNAFLDVPVIGPDGTAANAAPTNAHVKYIAPDNVVHVPPRQGTYARQAHVFSDDTPTVLGFFWDDFVVGVTDDPTQI
jgi:hypothetical protein